METTFGIGDIAVYIPHRVMRLEKLVARHSRSDPRLGRALARAVRRTGQVSLRFPEFWEDAATMAAQAALRLLSRMTAAEIATLRYIAVGTETSVDQAKPIAAHVQGMLQRAGFAVPDALSTFQIQHACAGGTISLLGVGAMLAMSRRTEQRGLVICTDVARYEVGTSAEITQGAGAVAMTVERSPRLLDLDIGGAGYSSRDVDDFFRPNGSSTARVKGRFSIDCYKRAAEDALLDLSANTDRTMVQTLEETDLFAFHAPFRTLPEDTLADLVMKYLDTDAAGAAEFLAQRQFTAGTAPTAHVGNVYCGAVFMGLAAALVARLRELDSGLVGKQVTLVSYGSGNTAVAVAGRVSAHAPRVIGSWTLDDQLNHGGDASLQEYDQWTQGHNEAEFLTATHRERLDRTAIPDRSFFLEAIRSDGYRVYQLNNL